MSLITAYIICAVICVPFASWAIQRAVDDTTPLTGGPSTWRTFSVFFGITSSAFWPVWVLVAVAWLIGNVWERGAA